MPLAVLRQARLPRWSKKHVVLTGDAAWCTTPLGGIGATLAVTGAYVLAGKLLRSSDLGAALSAYERAMRPMVEQGQGVPKIAPRFMHPQSRLGIGLLHRTLNLSSKPWARAIAGRFSGGGQKAPDFSAYPLRLTQLGNAKGGAAVASAPA